MTSNNEGTNALDRRTFLKTTGAASVAAATAGVASASEGDTQEDPTAKMLVQGDPAKPWESVYFDARDSSAPDGEHIVAYDWEVGFGGSTYTGRTLNLEFSETGSYNVQLTVTDSRGWTDSTSTWVTIYTETPDATFSFDERPDRHGVPFQVDASDSSAPDGDVAGYEWDFGDGTTKSGATATHSYGDGGEYTIELSVTDEYGTTGTATRTVSVEGACGRMTKETSWSGSLNSGERKSYTYTTRTESPCSTLVAVESEADADFDVYVTMDGRAASSDDHDRSATGFGNAPQLFVDQVDAGTELGVAVESYSGSGEYDLSVTEWGELDERGPEARFEITPSTPKAGKRATLDASDTSHPAGYAIESYDWTITRDSWWKWWPVTKSGQSAHFEWDSGGEQTVTLEVTDEWGRTDIATQTVQIEESDDGGWWPF